MAGFTINNLSQELIAIILHHARQPSSSFPADPGIISCLLCYKLWYSIGLQVVYRDVIVTTLIWHRFAQRFAHIEDHQSTLQMIKSLTMTLHSGPNSERKGALDGNLVGDVYSDMNEQDVEKSDSLRMVLW